MRLESFDDEIDVIGHLDFQQLDPRVDLGALDFGGERLVFEFLSHALRFQGGDAFGAHETASNDESGELVASEKSFVESALVGNVLFRIVRRDGVSELFLAALAEPGDDSVRVILGPLLVVGIV